MRNLPRARWCHSLGRFSGCDLRAGEKKICMCTQHSLGGRCMLPLPPSLSCCGAIQPDLRRQRALLFGPNSPWRKAVPLRTTARCRRRPLKHSRPAYTRQRTLPSHSELLVGSGCCRGRPGRSMRRISSLQRAAELRSRRRRRQEDTGQSLQITEAAIRCSPQCIMKHLTN